VHDGCALFESICCHRVGHRRDSASGGLQVVISEIRRQ
jgi:hypothetical protein